MRELIIAEFQKIRRMKMTYIAYIGVLFGIIISSVQLRTQINKVTFEQLANMTVYNNVVLILPFSLTLISGYIIDREYVQNTQKNLLIIPIYWSNIIKAKIVVMFSLSLWIGWFSSALLILTGLILNCSQITITIILKAVISNFVSHICVLIGTLPIILWFSKSRGKYIWGATFSLVLGVSGVFVANGKVVNWHPITTCFSIVHCSAVNTSILSVPYSCLAIIVYLLLSAFIYTAVYKK